tara:strand:- start:92 stop:688 length:597 start_codon:yes stop_codon:yes gene_type:complete
MTREILLEEAVARDRLYIGRHAITLGYELTPLQHDEASQTCDQKIPLLRKAFPKEDWTRRSAVKTIFATIEWQKYAFILPELGHNITSEAAEQMFEQSGLEHYGGRIEVSPEAIPGNLQAIGVCTPAITGTELEQLAGVFIHKSLVTYDPRVDISLARLHPQDAQAELRSMLLPGKAIPEILLREYGDTGKIHIVDMS